MAANRPAGILMSWNSFNIFMDRPSYLEVAELPLDERLERLRDPAPRAPALGAVVDQPEAHEAVRGLEAVHEAVHDVSENLS